MYNDVTHKSTVKHTWLHWERDEVLGKVCRVLKTKQVSMKMLISETVQDVQCPVQGVSLLKHLFTATW